MSKLPKLKLRNHLGYSLGEIPDFEEASSSLFSTNQRIRTLVVVDGKAINSYDELVQLAAQSCYKDKEFLEVVLIPVSCGG